MKFNKNVKFKNHVFVLLYLFIFSHNTHSQTAPDWVKESNKYSKVLLDVISNNFPERGSQLGLENNDSEIFDYSPGFNERMVDDLKNTAKYYKSELDKCKNVQVKQDLQILLSAAENDIEKYRLHDQYLMPYENVSSLIFYGLNSLLDERISEERQQVALLRLKKYNGTAPGYKPITQLAKAYMQKEWQSFNRIAPFKEKLERDISTSKNLMEGIRILFQEAGVNNYEKDHQLLIKQVDAYNNFIRDEILPKARTDFKIPSEIYSFNLKEYGIDMAIEDLQKRALVSFREIEAQMRVLANEIAKKHNYPSNNYRDVIRSMKKNILDSASILPFYQEVIKEIEQIIVRENIVTLPKREMIIRLATQAESAQIPSPFMSPPRFIGNIGEHGTFVLPTKVLGGTIDDFMHEAAAWPLTVHEGRPGHELQFSSIIEKGVSQARAIFALNSVNIEGWAMYSEQVMLPFLPIEGQFMTLWSRLVRAGRAFLDPGLNLGKLSPMR